MEKIKVNEAKEMVQAFMAKHLKEVNIIDNLGGEFVIEADGNYFTVVVKPHAYRGQLSPQILERFKANRDFLQMKEELMKNKKKSFT